MHRKTLTVSSSPYIILMFRSKLHPATLWSCWTLSHTLSIHLFIILQTLSGMNQTQIHPRGLGCNIKIEPTSSSCTRKVTLCPCSAVSLPSDVIMRRPCGGLPGHCWGFAVYRSLTPSVQLLETTFRYLKRKREICGRYCQGA